MLLRAKCHTRNHVLQGPFPFSLLLDECVRRLKGYRRDARGFVKFDRYLPCGPIVERNIFDSHCHLDRLLIHWKRNIVRQFNIPFEVREFFEGCITIISDPRDWTSKKLAPVS